MSTGEIRFAIRDLRTTLPQVRPTEILLSMLDCPACRGARGLLPQALDGRSYLACPLCRFWYPIEDEILILLPPERNPSGLRRDLGETVALCLERRPPRYVDMKVLVYSFYARMHELGEAFRVGDEPVVIDVGCSTGSFSAWLRPEQIYIGFDLSIESLRFARRATGQLFVQADAERMPLRPRSVPFFVCREVFEHLSDRLVASRELARVAQRGVLVVPTLEFPLLYDPINWVLVRRGKRLKFGIYGYGHRELYDVAGWRRLFEGAGLEVRSERPIGTGLLLNAFDVVWHTLYSWRDFDTLPRRAAPVWLTRAVFPLRRAMHRIDKRLMPRSAVSHAFEVAAS